MLSQQSAAGDKRMGRDMLVRIGIRSFEQDHCFMLARGGDQVLMIAAVLPDYVFPCN